MGSVWTFGAIANRAGDEFTSAFGGIADLTGIAAGVARSRMNPKRLRGSYLILAKHSFRRSSSERTCETRAFCSAAVPLLKNSAEAFLSRFCCQSRIAIFVAFWASDVDLTYVAMQASADEHIGHS
jgi:hypothetical protein